MSVYVCAHACMQACTCCSLFWVKQTFGLAGLVVLINMHAERVAENLAARAAEEPGQVVLVVEEPEGDEHKEVPDDEKVDDAMPTELSALAKRIPKPKPCKDVQEAQNRVYKYEAFVKIVMFCEADNMSRCIDAWTKISSKNLGSSSNDKPTSSHWNIEYRHI